MEVITGVDNGMAEYLSVLLIYWLMFLFIRYPKPVIELNFRNNFLFLACLWSIMMFTGNYLFYRLGVMSFLPWLNNFIHSFLWIGLCLTWLFYCTRNRPWWEQFVFFSFLSFIVKMAEHNLLGSWSMASYLGIDHPYAYLIVMSIVDGFYPFISVVLLKYLGKREKFGLYDYHLNDPLIG